MTEEIRTTSSTGGLKGVKPERYSFFPKAPLDLLARVYGYGDAKYGDAHNYRKGYEWSKNYDALQRHLTAWWERDEIDSESGLSHLGHAAWHIFALIVFSSDPKYKQFDDRYGNNENLTVSEVYARLPDEDRAVIQQQRSQVNEHAICYYEDATRPVSHVCLEHGQTSKYGINKGPNRACQAVDPWTMSGLMDQTEGMSTTVTLDRFDLPTPHDSERPFVHPNGDKVSCEYGYVTGPGGSVETGYYLCKIHESRTNRHPSEGANRPCNYIDPTGNVNSGGVVIPPPGDS